MMFKAIWKSLPIVIASLFLATMPTSQAAEPADLAGATDGRLRLSSNGTEICSFSPFAADAGWKFCLPKAVAVEGDAPFRFMLQIANKNVPGDVQVNIKDGNAEAVWNFAPTEEVSFNMLGINSDFPTAALAGGSWESDTEKGLFPPTLKGASVYGKLSRFLAITFANGRVLKLTFAQPTYVVIQDNRQWGGPSFSLRLGKSLSKLAAGERFAVSVGISVSEGMRYRKALPVTLKADNDWVALNTELDIVPGSALDMSSFGFAEGPCGVKGRIVITPEGHFAFANEPNKPRRFYGVNLCFTAQYLPKDQVDKLLDRLVRLGYNTLRIHHYESRLTNPEWKVGFDWDPAKVDQLDYLMAGCAKRGIWMTTDLYVSRPVSSKLIGLPGERVDYEKFKLLVPVYEPAFKDWMTFTRKFLDRVNPYTGKRIADDPALAWISLINEGPYAGLWGQASRSPEWAAAWNKWLETRYPNRDDLDIALGDLTGEEDPKLNNVAMPTNLKADTRRARVCLVFIAELEKTTYERMRDFLRNEIKCPAFLTNMNNAGPSLVPLHTARAEYDYVDEHFYVDHPVFIERNWNLPSSCPNTNPIREGAPGASASASVRLWGKPFTVSEFDYSGPGRFRGVGGILTGAMASLQDWDVVWRFAYSHKDKDNFEPAPMDYFNLVRDPLNLAADRLALFLYMRQDLKTAPSRLGVIIPKDLLRNPPGRLGVGGLVSVAWTTRMGTLLLGKNEQPPANMMIIPYQSGNDKNAFLNAVAKHKPSQSSQTSNVIQAETGELTLDPNEGVLTIDTPKSAGGYADPGKSINASASGVKIDNITTGATVFVNSLDQSPIKNSKRLLVTHLTDLQNTGINYTDSAQQVLLAWGGMPHLVRDGAATVHITLADAAAYSVWTLSTSGKRLEKLETKIDAGQLVFTASVRGKDGARMLYEIAR